MLRIIKTTSKNIDFKNLVIALDAYLKVTDGDEHSFYDKFNGMDSLKHIVIAYWKTIPIGCGALKAYNEDTLEVKRMFVLPKYRNKGTATQILNTLESYAAKLKYKTCILETGKRQKEAVAFYHKKGYFTIPNYGQYAQMENSICFKKNIFMV